MRKFSWKEAKNMTESQIYALVCRGLSQVCQALAEQSDSKSLDREFREKASTFTNLARIYEIPREAKKKKSEKP